MVADEVELDEPPEAAEEPEDEPDEFDFFAESPGFEGVDFAELSAVEEESFDGLFSAPPESEEPFSLDEEPPRESVR